MAATGNGDLVYTQTASGTANIQVFTCTVPGDRLVYAGMRFDNIAADPQRPLKINLFDGTTNAGKLLATFQFANQVDFIDPTAGATDFMTMIGAKDLGILNLGSGFPLTTGLFAEVLQRSDGLAAGSTAVLVTFEALFARKV